MLKLGFLTNTLKIAISCGICPNFLDYTRLTDEASTGRPNVKGNGV